mmetsp:Transcript_41239/g.96341  ORF Transcript_41239/g.96341 Transcript_41239/m.96341 type:complete len:215 (+) Transcript_41239:448-1092(+)
MHPPQSPFAQAQTRPPALSSRAWSTLTGSSGILLSASSLSQAGPTRPPSSAMSTDWGTLNPEALKKREDTKLKHYEFGYLQSLTAPWTFVPLVCSTLGHLQPRFLRLINFLAERQAARALQSDLRGESPARIRKLLRLRMQGRVACAVAVATAMRLGGFWADIHHPIRLPPRHIPDVPYTAECDLPLFPRGSEDAPVRQAYPLPRGGPADDLFD